MTLRRDFGRCRRLHGHLQPGSSEPLGDGRSSPGLAAQTVGRARPGNRVRASAVSRIFRIMYQSRGEGKFPRLPPVMGSDPSPVPGASSSPHPQFSGATDGHQVLRNPTRARGGGGPGSEHPLLCAGRARLRPVSRRFLWLPVLRRYKLLEGVITFFFGIIND